MPPLHLLIKPVSGSCHMRCGYCFYADETSSREIASYGRMTPDILEMIVKTALGHATRECTFAFQGGEPTLAGLAFYENLVAMVREHNHKNLTVHYAIQTNGLDMDRDWVEFFVKHKVLVGLSLDGGKEVHDRWRYDAAGRGTYSRVMRAAQLLDSGGAQFNILTVVTAQLAASIRTVYGFYRRNRFHYQQYIPCLDPLGEPRGQQPYSLTPELYGKFLCDLFDLWYRDLSDKKPVSIRWFDNLAQMLRGHPPESCGMAGQCGMQYVVEADGGVYPCDFYMLDGYRLGHITEGFAALDQKRAELRFVEDSRYVAEQCQACRWFPLCRGGCRRDRDAFDGGALPVNAYCAAFRLFFERCYSRLESLARL